MKNSKFRSISTRLVSDIVLFCSILFILIIGAFYWYSRQSIQENNEKLASSLAETTVLKISNVLSPVERILNNYTWMLEQELLPADSVYTLTRKVVENNSNVVGCAIAFEPYTYIKKGYYFAPYSYRTDSSVVSIQLGNANYEYFFMDWYQIPHTLNRSYWSNPYFDEGGANQLLTTYSVPFYALKDSTPRGIMTVDVSLEWLAQLVNQVKILDSGYAAIIGPNGTFISHPDQEFIMNKTIFSYAEETNNSELRAIGQNMIKGKTAYQSVSIENTSYQLYYTALPGMDWSIMILFPEKEMFASLHFLFIILLCSIVVALFSLAIVIQRIVKAKTSSLSQFAEAAKKTARGDFKAQLPVITANDEILQLKEAFAFLQTEIQEYIRNLQQATIEREKMESELRIARNIQMGLIPKIFPPFPNHPQIDLYAELEPAREVGGDLYDFFLTDDNHLCFVIGDVSGKGVPASLFMAVTRTLLRTVANQNKSPQTIINELNQALASDNEENMFVTLFLGILNLKTGELDYVNAGHNAPILLREGQPPRAVPVVTNIPLGVLPQFDFAQGQMLLESNDNLFLYTDGINEAENISQELYSTERLMRSLEENQSKDPQELIGAIIASVNKFADGNVQSDDMTLLALKYSGQEII
ncbi:SpoIIE family protein phosphatase [Maribellus comscasis]|uniref:SpoIIE family protein phosphatase n=1 Tax=Maribellus comscasis TaxID=2681766 RepID=A0A6I6JPU5_9BACT|nr:SpoIIE family protein phosphatase [Maribellus comscasis]QGY43169.1 SpoIIE family protein phosphatase [Maribellus comscasis]